MQASEIARMAKEVYDVQSDFDMQIFGQSFGLAEQSGQVVQAKTGFRLINAQSAFAICARGKNANSGDVFIVFRGTTSSNYGADWITDARMGLNISSTGEFVHSGFNHTFNTLREQLVEYLASQKDVRTVHCIGHSLGGAVANLAADWIASNYQIKVKLYSFGAPRVGYGEMGFARNITTKLSPDNILRVYHSADPVPMVPLFPYAHAPAWGLPCYMPNAGQVFSFSQHKMGNYLNSVGSKAWKELRRAEPQFSFSAIKQWLDSDAIDSTASSTVWHKLNAAAFYLVKAVLAVVAVPLVAGMTVADYLAMVLSKGLELAVDISGWILKFIQKLMRMVGYTVVKAKEEVTTQILQSLLYRVSETIYREVRKAMKSL